ncbi:hypothetical protein ABBQ38_002276 [Trebouxia sp. C0009 RCD-2024]
MSNFPFPGEAPVLHVHSCPVAEVVDTIPHTGRLQSRGCKRRHDSLQGASPLQSAFVVASSLPFDTIPYGKGSAANRSASMDSDISSWSPVPKRHCFYPPQASSKPDSAQLAWHQTQQQAAFQQQQHPSLEVPSLSDAQQAYALEVMLSQSATAPQTAALVATLRHFQCLRQAAALHHTRTQGLCHSSQSVDGQAATWSDSTLSVSTLLKLQATYSQLLQASQHQQHSHDTLPQQHVLTDNRQMSLAASMTQLQSISTPAQQCEEHSGLASHAHPLAPVWYQNHVAPAESNTAAYEPVQPQIHLQWAAYPEQPSQPEFAWQSAATVCEAPPRQALTGVTTQMLHRQQQQQEQMAFQLAQEKRFRLQQHRAREQQVLLDRQAALSSTRPALTFPELVAFWARDLSLQRCESVYLACHLWTRVQQQVSIAYMHLLGAEKPWETMLLGCLWLAAKLEECRRGVPTASKAGALVGVDKGVMGGVELYLMQLVDWAPLAEWKDRPLQFEDDSWC